MDLCAGVPSLSAAPVRAIAVPVSEVGESPRSIPCAERVSESIPNPPRRLEAIPTVDSEPGSSSTPELAAFFDVGEEKSREPTNARLSGHGDPAHSLAGALVAAAPFILPVAVVASGPPTPGRPQLVLFAAIASVVLLACGGLTLEVLPRLSRFLLTVGVLTATGLAVPALLDKPALALLSLSALVLSVHLLWPSAGRKIRAANPRIAALERARSACLVAAGAWLVRATGDTAPSFSFIEAAGASLALAAVTGLAAVIRMRRSLARRIGPVTAALATLVLAAVAVATRTLPPLHAAAVAASVLAIFSHPLRTPGGLETSGWDLIAGHPARLLVVTFLALCALATLSLSLPVCTTGDSPPGIVDLAFTGVSAVCVTGLIVLDTPVAFTSAGEGVILAAIQLGGLGIMTFSTVGLHLLGRRMSLRHETAVAHLMSVADRSQLLRSTQRVVMLTLLVEAAGATILTFLFAHDGETLGTAAWRGVFTSVSAFCNAGFALQSTSLIPYQDSPAILHVVALLIIIGGLSPAVAIAVVPWARGKPVPVQAKLAAIVTVVLLLLGTLFFAALEWDGVLGGLDPIDRVHNAWFQSATLRTAGFNSVTVESVRPATLTLMIVWMFIGGSPGSTAGGIKTTTAAVLVLAVVAAIRGLPNAILFGRSIPHRTVYRAAAVASLGALSILTAFVALLVTQRISADEAIFETVSALGTVGLSIGGTAALDEIGKAIIIGCMFFGRIGPLTLFLFLSQQLGSPTWQRPVQELDVG